MWIFICLPMYTCTYLGIIYDNFCLLPVRKALINLTTFPSIPSDSSLKNSLRWGAVLNALATSIFRISTVTWWFRYSVNLSNGSCKFVNVDLLFWIHVVPLVLNYLFLDGWWCRLLMSMKHVYSLIVLFCPFSWRVTAASFHFFGLSLLIDKGVTTSLASSLGKQTI